MDTLESFANLDFHRRERTGIPEAVLAEGKTSEQAVALLQAVVEKSGIALATRVSGELGRFIQQRMSEKYSVSFNEVGRTVVAKSRDFAPDQKGGMIAVLAAGTSDVPVAEEARVTAEVMGCRVLTFYDVGVAGIHRLVKPLEEIHHQEVGAVVAVAGMDGALPTVVRGLIPVPVIGVPTSIGYGYGGKGEAALMTMLQSCAPGLTVVNIDNGYGAGATAALIANRLAMSHSSNNAQEKKKKNRQELAKKPLN